MIIVTTEGVVNSDDISQGRVSLGCHIIDDQELSLYKGTLINGVFTKWCTWCTRARNGGEITQGPMVAECGELPQCKSND